MPALPTGSAKLRAQIFMDEELEKRVLASTQNDNEWINGLLARVAGALRSIGKRRGR